MAGRDGGVGVRGRGPRRGGLVLGVEIQVGGSRVVFIAGSSSRRSDDDDDECKRRFHHHRFLAPSPRRRVYLRLRLRVLSQGRLHRARGRRPLRQDDAVREARRQAQGERGED